MVNVNIPKELSEWNSTPIKQYSNKTPCKKCKKELDKYLSAEK